MVASESQSGSKKPVGVEGVEPTGECFLQPQSQALADLHLWSKHPRLPLAGSWARGCPGEWAEEMGVCWALCRLVKPVHHRYHCTGIHAGTLRFFLFLSSVFLAIAGEMYFWTQLVNMREVVQESTVPGNSASFAMLYSQSFNIGLLSPGIFYIPKWLPGSSSAMGLALFSCCWIIDVATLQKSSFKPMLQYKSLMWDFPFCSSSHPSDTQRQLAEGMGWVREERMCEQMGKNGIKYQNTKIGAPAEKWEQKEVFH